MGPEAAKSPETDAGKTEACDNEPGRRHGVPRANGDQRHEQQRHQHDDVQRRCQDHRRDAVLDWALGPLGNQVDIRHLAEARRQQIDEQVAGQGDDHDQLKGDRDARATPRIAAPAQARRGRRGMQMPPGDVAPAYGLSPRIGGAALR